MIACMQKKSSKVSERSFAVGTIAETLQSMGDAVSGFVQLLYPVVMAVARDEDEEVRSNAIYGLGVLMANGGHVALLYPFGITPSASTKTYIRCFDFLN